MTTLSLHNGISGITPLIEFLFIDLWSLVVLEEDVHVLKNLMNFWFIISSCLCLRNRVVKIQVGNPTSTSGTPVPSKLTVFVMKYRVYWVQIFLPLNCRYHGSGILFLSLCSLSWPLVLWNVLQWLAITWTFFVRYDRYYARSLTSVINLIYRPFYVRFLRMLCGCDVHERFENYFCLKLIFV